VTGSNAAAVSALDRELAAAGLNLRGCLAAARYDALVPAAWSSQALLPAAKTALVLAAGGRGFFAAFAASPEADRGDDPLDAFTFRVVSAAAEAVDGRAVFAFEQRGGLFADFVELARAAGLGAGSRLGLLLHPVYGPWMSIRAIVLTRLDLPPSPALVDFEPCPSCAAPCARACPGGAPRAEGFDVPACIATRRITPGCGNRCEARRACVVGPEHRYAEGAEAHHMRSLPGP
jgi:hypothetical protein